MRLYKHNDYTEYRDAQILKWQKKEKFVWVKKGELLQIATTVKTFIPDSKFGICHGVRNGFENNFLEKVLAIPVLGTDISPEITKYPNCIEWDFHDLKPEWIKNVDFIYSNSIDHSYDPEKCLDVWMRCVKTEGLCFIHWNVSNQDLHDSADCFTASEKEYRELLTKKYRMLKEMKTMKTRIIFVIQHSI